MHPLSRLTLPPLRAYISLREEKEKLCVVKLVVSKHTSRLPADTRELDVK
jgi:hypothetical protein